MTVQDDLWLPGQPSLGGGKDCAVLRVNGTQVGLEAVVCTKDSKNLTVVCGQMQSPGRTVLRIFEFTAMFEKSL
jgi:hypothetical protein